MYRKGAPLPGISTTALAVLSLLLVLVTVPAIAVLPAEWILFQPESYLRALDNQRFYTRFPELAADALLGGEQPDLPGMGDGAIEYLDRDDAVQVLDALLPEDWTRARAETVLGNFGDFVNFRRPDLSLPLDLTALKARVAGDEGRAASRALVRSWPACSAEDAGRIAAEALSGNLQGIPVCAPPQVLQPVIEGAVHASLTGLSLALPDRLELSQPLTGDASEQGLRGPLIPGFWTWFQWYSWLRWLLRLTPVFALSILIWMVLLTIRSLPDLFHSLSQPLMQAGLLSVFLSSIMLFFGNRLAAGFIAGQIPFLPAPFETPLAAVLHEVWARASAWSLYVGLAVLVVAILFSILERVFTLPD